GDVPRVHGAPGGGMEAGGERDGHQELQQHLVDRRLVPGDDPEEEEHAVRGGTRDQLAVGERGEEEPTRHEGRRQELEAEVTRHQRSRPDGREQREDQRVERGCGDQEGDDGEAGDELAGDDLHVTHGIGPQQLERAELPLLGEQAHREERHDDEQPLLDVDELVLPEAALQIHAPHEDVEANVGVEVVPRQHQEDRRQPIEEEGGEVERELLPGDREHDHHGRGRPPPTKRRNISSSASASWRSSTIGQPWRCIASPAARAMSPAAASTTSPAGPSATLSTPGSAASTAHTSGVGPATRRTSRWRAASRVPSSSGVPSPTTRPRATTITRSHSASTSERMWLEKRTV